MSVIWYRAEAMFPHLGLWPGDLVRYEPESPTPIELYRLLPPNHGALLGAIEDGALKPCGASLPAVRLRLESGSGPEPESASPLPAEVTPLRLA